MSSTTDFRQLLFRSPLRELRKALKIRLQRLFKADTFLDEQTLNMEKLGIAEDDTIIIKKSEKDWFERPFEELTVKMVGCLNAP